MSSIISARGQQILITGGTSGVGLETARLLTAANADVIISWLGSPFLWMVLSPALTMGLGLGAGWGSAVSGCTTGCSVGPGATVRPGAGSRPVRTRRGWRRRWPRTVR